MLKRTLDRKVTNSVTKSGKARIANAFSLPAGLSCPGMTKYCDNICYAGKLEKMYPNFRDTVMHNYNVLKDMPYADMVNELDAMITAFVIECDKWEAPPLFRIHADGDFFSQDYTQAWIDVMQKHNEVRFWVYTRVFNSAVNIWFEELPNCSLYFSADKDNWDQAFELRDTFGIKLAMVADTFDEAKSLMNGTRAVRCPENNKSLPLIDIKGSACKRCGLCVFERNNVLFSKTKK